MSIEQKIAFNAWAESQNPKTYPAEWQAFEAGWQAALTSPEVQALREALEKCRFALEPYDDIKPRDWVTDRQNLRRAHEAARAALAQGVA